MIFLFSFKQKQNNKIYLFVQRAYKIMIRLGQQLNSLKLDQSLIKELNQDDIEFAQKQFKKMYAQQMSKISSKIEKIQKVKNHLSHIEQSQAIKQKEIKLNLEKKNQVKQKNKYKIINEKLKSYRIHHEMWENKILNIKRKNKQELKQNIEKQKKYKDDVDKFWKTKTQEINKLANRRKQYQQRCQSFTRKSRKIEHEKIKTQLRDSPIPQFKRQNTRNTQDYQKSIAKINQSENKSIRFATQNSNDLRSINAHARENGSYFTNNHSIHSLRDHKDSKHSLKMPQMDQNKFSQNLHSNNHQTLKLKSHSQFPKVDNTKNLSNSRMKQNDQKVNISFQKAMKKLDKMHKLKEKQIKKTKQNQKNFSPCQPRKSIDAQGYRLLRAKSEAKKQNRKNYTEQNAQTNEIAYQPNTTGKIIAKNQTTIKQSRYHKMNTVNESRMSISDSRNIKQQYQSKQRQSFEESQRQKLKKDKILRAIRDKIFKIKIQEMQKFSRIKNQH